MSGKKGGKKSKKSTKAEAEAKAQAELEAKMAAEAEAAAAAAKLQEGLLYACLSQKEFVSLLNDIVDVSDVSQKREIIANALKIQDSM
jgi:hypothetical protein